MLAKLGKPGMAAFGLRTGSLRKDRDTEGGGTDRFPYQNKRHYYVCSIFSLVTMADEGIEALCRGKIPQETRHHFFKKFFKPPFLIKIKCPLLRGGRGVVSNKYPQTCLITCDEL